MIIAPNSTYQGLQVAISSDDIKKARAERGQVLFWGSAEYADIFEPKKLHYISVCTVLKPQLTAEGKIFIQPIPLRADCNRSD